MNALHRLIGLAGIGLTLAQAACASQVRDNEEVGTGSSELSGEVCASGTTLKGIDVSWHNGDVDWRKVKASGRTFAFARVSDGLTDVDPKFATNWPAIKSAGLVRGVYQYFRPRRSGNDQADLLLRKVAAAGGLKAGDLPPVLDIETSDGFSSDVVVSRAKSWLARVESKIGVKPIVYTGNHMAAIIGTHFSSYALWIAHYRVPCPRLPAGWGTWAFWQNSDSTAVSGAGNEVDTSFFNGGRSKLDELTLHASIADLAVDADDLELDADAADDDDPRGGTMGDGVRAEQARSRAE